ncbi:TetR/AcrR family transcriptional regulator [Streptomyces sp. NPDC002514]|uniref:TetR/AcrR family transcriptional regulator n=1 Tax=Streptomyces sp. NPDC001270 TaxID=3364554 RepID=UPI0036B35FCE
MPSRSRAGDHSAATGPAAGSGSGPGFPSEPDSDSGSDSAASTARAQTRLRVIEAAADLLEREGRDAVTTRAVAVAAGLQPPAIYRLFGDKEGLLEAVAEYGFARFVASKHVDPDPQDPIEDLRAGWDLAVGFGLANPALFVLMYSEPNRATSAAFKAGMEILMGRVRRLAAGGWLRVDEHLAAMLIHATARGAVLTWLSFPADRRDPDLLTMLRESMVAAVTNQEPAVRDAGPAGAARALRAALPEQTVLSGAERHLLGEWLDRLTGGG